MKQIFIFVLVAFPIFCFASTCSPEPADPPLTVLPIGSGVLSLFPNGKAYFSADGFNREGNGTATACANTVPAYTGSMPITQIVAVGSGVDTLFPDGSIYYSPNGQNLGGGCIGSVCTQIAYSSSTAPATFIASVGGGVDATMGNPSGYSAYYSPNGLNLGGGGASTLIYSGGVAVSQIVPIGSGAVTVLFSNGAAYYSPNNNNLGGGGSTVSAYTGSIAITRIVPISGGMLTQFANNSVYLSPNGQNLGGGGSTISVASWVKQSAGPFPARDSGKGVVFNSKLLLSGGFSPQSSPPNPMNTCASPPANACVYYDLWTSVDETPSRWNSPATRAYSNEGIVDPPAADTLKPIGFWDYASPLEIWNSKLWAIGSTIWNSADGSTWTEQSTGGGTSAPTTNFAGENTRGFVLGSYLYYLELNIGDTPYTDVQRTNSANGNTWTDLGPIQSSAMVKMEPRCGGVLFQSGSQIWIEGGKDAGTALNSSCDSTSTFKNDIWSTSNGTSWTQQSQVPPWAPRQWPCVATDASGTVWLAGGYTADFTNNAGTIRYQSNLADVWYTKDGTTWKQFKADVGSQLPDDDVFYPTHAPTCYIDTSLNQLVIVAGKATSPPNLHDSGTVSSNVFTLQLPAAGTLP